MKVIFLQDVAGAGKRLDVKVVSSGYAMNMLIPRGLAKEATVSALKQVEAEKARIEGERKMHEDLLIKNLSDLEGKTIHLFAKANEQGHLFAAIHTDTIAGQLKTELRVDTHPDFIKIDEPIKSIGEYQINVEVQDKKAKFILVVEALK